MALGIEHCDILIKCFKRNAWSVTSCTPGTFQPAGVAVTSDIYDTRDAASSSAIRMYM